MMICDAVGVYHVELRRFPHNFCRFNLTEEELRGSVIDPWVRGEWVELGERKWHPQDAKLTVLEGPALALGELSIGRGWRSAERQGHDVTERLLASAKTDLPSAVVESYPSSRPHMGGADPGALHHGGSVASPDAVEGSDDSSFAVELQGLLAGGAQPLGSAWQLARKRNPEMPASQCLALVERTVQSLSAAGSLAVLGVSAAGQLERCESQAAIARALLAPQSWSVFEGEDAVILRLAEH